VVCGRAGRWIGGWASGRWLEHIHMPSHRVLGGKSRVRGGRVRTQSALRLAKRSGGVDVTVSLEI
jgi:hypothetical protein